MNEITEFVKRLQVENAQLRKAIQKAVMRLGAPTMDYYPPIELRELKESNEEASRVLMKALALVAKGKQ